MNVPWYRFRNFFHKLKDRAKHPPPVYKKVGGIDAVVHRGATGKDEVLKNISYTYAKRWGVGTGDVEPPAATDAPQPVNSTEAVEDADA